MVTVNIAASALLIFKVLVTFCFISIVIHFIAVKFIDKWKWWEIEAATDKINTIVFYTAFIGIACMILCVLWLV